jgi:hypothetical protein
MRTDRSTAIRCVLWITVATLACLASAGVASAASVHFESPSGNINCYVYSTPSSFAECLVRSGSWPHLPPKPRSCTLDWAPYSVGLTGQRVSLGACRGDVGPLCGAGSGRCTVLAYGTSVTVGTVRCSSATTGVTCRSTIGAHHGFRIARQSVVRYG